MKPLLLAILLLSSLVTLASAGSATWSPNPISGDWNTAANWTPNTVPNSSRDRAKFAASDVTGIAISASTQVREISVNPGASSFAITIPHSLILTVSGTGILNSSGVTQNFIAAVDPGAAVDHEPILRFLGGTAGVSAVLTSTGGTQGGTGAHLEFYNSSTAGVATILNGGGEANSAGGETLFFDTANAAGATFSSYGGASGSGGLVEFHDSSTANTANFTNGGANGSFATGGATNFFDNATAGNAVLNCEGALQGILGGSVSFSGNSTAGNATITLDGGQTAGAGGGLLTFLDSATADDATIVANGGLSGAGGAAISLNGDSLGGNASFQINGNASLDITQHNPPGITVGSIEGDGTIFVGSNDLTVGANNVSTTFSGSTQGTGSITKVGTGVLTLSGANTHTGGTNIQSGTLLATTKGASATGSGTVGVNGGTLGGTSRLTGAIIVGVGGGGAGAFLAPGVNGTGKLSSQAQVVFNSDATYVCEIDTNRIRSDQIAAKGVIIFNSTAHMSLVAIGNRVIPSGTVFTIIKNTRTQAISGTFANLPDSSTVTVGSNTFQANYEGGDGNDLTLTVVQ